jgi:prophage regulatory protein
MQPILRIQDVIAVTRLSRSTIYRLIQAGQFPKPIKLTARASGWRHEAIEQWLSERTETN